MKNVIATLYIDRAPYKVRHPRQPKGFVWSSQQLRDSQSQVQNAQATEHPRLGSRTSYV